MRCPCCGGGLDEHEERCTRCGADVSRVALHHERLITVAYVLAASVTVAIIIYFVLRWHEYQTLGRILG